MADKPIGRPPLKRGEKSVHLGVRVPESTYAQLMVLVDEANVRSEAQGLPPVNVSWVARSLIIRGLAQPAERRVAPTEDASDPASNGHAGADEVVTSQPTHRKRVRAPVPSVVPPELPVSQPEPEEPSEDVEDLLRDTPL